MNSFPQPPDPRSVMNDPRYWTDATPQEYERRRTQMEQITELTFKMVTACSRNRHIHPHPVFACRHVLEQDSQHPDGIIFMPRKFYICGKCVKLLENKKFAMATELAIECNSCIAEEAIRLQQIRRDLFKDLTKAN